MKHLMFVLAILSLAGCASTSNIVRKDLGHGEALVKLGVQNIKVGDRVSVLREDCREVGRKDRVAYTCSKTPIGEASVMELRSPEEAVIRADSGVTIRNGQYVEKITN